MSGLHVYWVPKSMWFPLSQFDEDWSDVHVFPLFHNEGNFERASKRTFEKVFGDRHFWDVLEPIKVWGLKGSWRKERRNFLVCFHFGTSVENERRCRRPLKQQCKAVTAAALAPRGIQEQLRIFLSIFNETWKYRISHGGGAGSVQCVTTRVALKRRKEWKRAKDCQDLIHWNLMKSIFNSLAFAHIRLMYDCENRL